jgi:hypothetical protein
MKTVEIAYWMLILSRREVSTALVSMWLFVMSDFSYFKDISVAGSHEKIFTT